MFGSDDSQRMVGMKADDAGDVEADEKHYGDYGGSGADYNVVGEADDSSVGSSVVVCAEG